MKNKRILTIGCMLLAVVLTGCQSLSLDAEEIEGKSEAASTEIVIVTDIHHLATSLKDDGEAFSNFVASGDGKLLQYTDELMSAFVSKMQASPPEAVVISGDLTNNGEKESHKELAGYLAEIEKAGIDVFVIPGNHDLRNPFALGFEGNSRKRVDTVEPSEFAKIYKNFGYEDALSRDPDSLSYLAMPTQDLALLMLDTNRYERNLEIGVPNPSGEVRESTMEWMRGVLESLEGTEVIAVMHHNAFPHSEMFIDNYVIDNSEEVMALLAEAGVKVILSGHIHIQDLKEDPATGIVDLTTTAFSVYPERYGVLTMNDDAFLYETKPVEMEAFAKARGWQDPNLLDFQAFSAEDFGNRAKVMMLSQMPAGSQAEDVQKMAEVMAALNLAYFAGEEADRKGGILEMDGYASFRKIENPFLQHYTESILKDETNDNTLRIERKGKK